MKGRGANAPLPFFCSAAMRVSINSENDHAVPHPDINLLVAWSPHQFCALRVALIKRRHPRGLSLSHASIAPVEKLDRLNLYTHTATHGSQIDYRSSPCSLLTVLSSL